MARSTSSKKILGRHFLDLHDTSCWPFFFFLFTGTVASIQGIAIVDAMFTSWLSFQVTAVVGLLKRKLTPFELAVHLFVKHLFWEIFSSRFQCPTGTTLIGKLCLYKLEAGKKAVQMHFVPFVKYQLADISDDSESKIVLHTFVSSSRINLKDT